MQNTMVRGDGQLGKKIKIRSKGKKLKGERKKEENYIKKGGKALKCIFLGYNLKRGVGREKKGEKLN